MNKSTTKEIKVDSMVTEIHRILKSDHIEQHELSFNGQQNEIRDDTDLYLMPLDELRMIYNRAKTLDYFYHDPDVKDITGATTAAQNHDMIQVKTIECGDCDAPRDLMDRLFNVIDVYHTNTIDISKSAKHWSQTNDRFVIATKPYLFMYYRFVSRPTDNSLAHEIEGYPGLYIVDTNKTLHNVTYNDVQLELKGLANYLLNNANSTKLNQKYSGLVSTTSAN